MGSFILDYGIIAIVLAAGVLVVWKAVQYRKKPTPPPRPVQRQVRPPAPRRAPRATHVDLDLSAPAEIPHDRRTGEVIDDDYFAALRDRRARGHQAADVRGKQLWEWIPAIDEMKRAGQNLEAADLTMECIDAMERHSKILGYTDGAAGWYKRAAIIYRELRDYGSEIAVIDRALAYMPTNEGLLQRREKAVALRDKAR